MVQELIHIQTFYTKHKTLTFRKHLSKLYSKNVINSKTTTTKSLSTNENQSFKKSSTRIKNRVSAGQREGIEIPARYRR